MTHPWPLFDLRIRTPRLELRLPTDDDLLRLLEVATAGIHSPDVMPFRVAWTDLPAPEFGRSFLRFFWSARAAWTADDWSLPLAVVREGEPIGVQEISGRFFGTRRTVETGSWLGRRFQRQGSGTEMRAAVLFFAFEGLGALAAESAALEGNGASARVSEKLGYRPNGDTLVAPRGAPVPEHRFRLTRADWRRDVVPVTIEGLDRCLPLFGAGDWAVAT